MPEQVKRRKTHEGPPPSRAPPTESDLLAAQVDELRAALAKMPHDATLLSQLAELEDALRSAQEQERGARIATELLNMASRFEAGVGRDELRSCIARLQELAEETMVLDGASREEAARAVAEARARGVTGAAGVVAAAVNGQGMS